MANRVLPADAVLRGRSGADDLERGVAGEEPAEVVQVLVVPGAGQHLHAYRVADGDVPAEQVVNRLAGS